VDTRDGAVLDDPRSLAHPSPVTAVALTADGGLLTATQEGNLYLWNPGTGRVLRTIRGHVDAVRGIALAPDGTAVFSAGDRSAKRWPMTNDDKK
jgi:WD40 repeat protein